MGLLCLGVCECTVAHVFFLPRLQVSVDGWLCYVFIYQRFVCGMNLHTGGSGWVDFLVLAWLYCFPQRVFLLPFYPKSLYLHIGRLCGVIVLIFESVLATEECWFLEVDKFFFSD